MDTHDLLQERLEWLEMGRPLDECLRDLTPEDVALFELAAGLRTVEYPEPDPTQVLRQRAALLASAAKEKSMKRTIRQYIEGLFGRPLPRWLVPVTAFSGVVVFLMIFALVAVIGGGLLWRSNRDHRLEATLQAQTPDTTEPSQASTADTTEYQVYIPMAANPLVLDPDQAALQEIQGVVQIQSDAGMWETVREVSKVIAGQHIRTGAFSGVGVVFADGSKVVLGSETDVTLDEVDVQTEGGPRVIVLAQSGGTTAHAVVANTVAGSRYEVHTPSAVGVAKGTVFQVRVASDQVTQVSVDEGAVAVTGSANTVTVEAGQATTVAGDTPPAEPAFRITGEGEVTQTGATWIVAGQLFETHAGTIIVGNPQVGDWVFVQGRLLPDNTRVADWISLLRRSPANSFTLTGEVEAINDVVWTVAGQTVALTETTSIDPDIEVGDLVQVEGFILADGILQATRITRVEDMPGLPFEFEGIVEVIAPSLWMISGVDVAVDAATEIAPGIAVGDVVKVEGRILDDGVWLAEEIKPVDDVPPTFEFTGLIESMDPWIVAGIAFEVRPWTEIDANLEIGELVKVEGRIMEDGTWVAFEIKRQEEEVLTPHIIFVGRVDSIAPWIVSGLPLPVDEETHIGEGILVGMLVRVEITLLPDGTWKVVSIDPLQPLPWGAGCLTFAGVVVDFEDGQLQLVGWPALALDADVEIEGDVLPNAVVLIQLCFAEDGTPYIVSVVVIYVPVPVVVTPPPSPAPGDEGEKVTICHKPDNKKGGETITISRSALPAHLDHGDTLGSCP